MRRGPLLVDGAMAQLGRHGAAQHQLLLKARHQRVRVHHCAGHARVWVGGQVGGGGRGCRKLHAGGAPNCCEFSTQPLKSGARCASSERVASTLSRSVALAAAKPRCVSASA
tara:strand:- start:119 stop:454 length:336 start_codon:yes stop_codon:yes gene_type:complete